MDIGEAALSHQTWKSWVPLSLRSALHDRLLQDLVAASSETRSTRAGASEKSERLVIFAKLILPISPADANSVFNHAIEVAGELDSEIVFQLRFLRRLVSRGLPGYPTRRSPLKVLATSFTMLQFDWLGMKSFRGLMLCRRWLLSMCQLR